MSSDTYDDLEHNMPDVQYNYRIEDLHADSYVVAFLAFGVRQEFYQNACTILSDGLLCMIHCTQEMIVRVDERVVGKGEQRTKSDIPCYFNLLVLFDPQYGHFVWRSRVLSMEMIEHWQRSTNNEQRIVGRKFEQVLFNISGKR